MGDISGEDRLQISYEIGTDTIIDGVAYRNLLFIQRYSDKCCDWGYYFNENVEDDTLGYFGAIRNEEKKVYFYQYEDVPYGLDITPPETEVLLYDFGLQEGDSVYFEYIPTAGYYHIIDVDSILLTDGFYHRTLITDIDASKVWIEGVGEAERGLFGNYFFNVLGGDNYSYYAYLSFMKNDMILYPTDGGDCDIGGINPIQDVSQYYNIYFSDDILQVNTPT